jgi:hypothetical protein
VLDLVRLIAEGRGDYCFVGRKPKCRDIGVASCVMPIPLLKQPACPAHFRASAAMSAFVCVAASDALVSAAGGLYEFPVVDPLCASPKDNVHVKLIRAVPYANLNCC